MREKLSGMRDAGWQREDRKLSEVALVETGASVFAPGIPRPLPVLISLLGRRAFGPTAVLGIPSADRTDKAIFEQLTRAAARRGALRHAGKWLGKEAPLVTRPAQRFRAADFPITRQRAWGAPTPIVHCDACGTVPVPLDQLPVRLPEDLSVTAEGNALLERPDFLNTECPSCGGPAQRETDTLDCHFDAASQQYPLPAPTADRGESLLTHPELERWVPVHAYINGADTGSFVLDQRTITKMLRDLGHFTWLPDGECYERTYTHEMVQLDGRKMSKHLGNTITPAGDRRAVRRRRAAARDAARGRAGEGVHVGRQPAHLRHRLPAAAVGLRRAAAERGARASRPRSMPPTACAGGSRAGATRRSRRSRRTTSGSTCTARRAT